MIRCYLERKRSAAATTRSRLRLSLGGAQPQPGRRQPGQVRYTDPETHEWKVGTIHADGRRIVGSVSVRRSIRLARSQLRAVGIGAEASGGFELTSDEDESEEDDGDTFSGVADWLSKAPMLPADDTPAP